MKLVLTLFLLQFSLYSFAQKSNKIPGAINTIVDNNLDIYISVSNRAWKLLYTKDSSNSLSGQLVRIPSTITPLTQPDSTAILLKITMVRINEENIASIEYSKIDAIKTNVNGKWEKAIRKKIKTPRSISSFLPKKGLNLTLGYGSLSYLFMEEYCPKYSCNNQFISNDRSHSMYLGLSYFFKWANVEIGYRRVDFPVVLFHSELYSEVSINILCLVPSVPEYLRLSPIFGAGKAYERQSYFKGNYSTGKEGSYLAFGVSASYGSFSLFYKNYQYSDLTFDYQRSMAIYEVKPKYHEVGLKVNIGRVWFRSK